MTEETARSSIGHESREVRVVVVTMFEGEAKRWRERLPLPERVSFPQGPADLGLHPGLGILGLVTGVGTGAAVASVMALGMDPRFDLTGAYWVVAGIGGGNPNVVSVGSAAWAEWVVDCDLAHQVDPREAPDDWPAGRIPLFQRPPYREPAEPEFGEVWRLEPGLVRWAYAVSRETPLADSDELRRLRAEFAAYPNAVAPPTVLRGDVLSGQTMWHGRIMNQWAELWVRYWTQGQGVLAITAMEDTGTLRALALLGRAGRVDPTRVLVLRAASNYSLQPDGLSAGDSLLREEKSDYSAYAPALEAAYAAASPVVIRLATNWDEYSACPPYCD